MKKKIFSLLGVIIALVLIFSACKKHPIEVANDAYDYNSIVPKIMTLSGIPGTVQLGRTYSLVVPTRGGSTFAWQLLNGDAEFYPIPGKDSYHYGFYTFTDDDTIIAFSVTETTVSGKTDTWQDTIARTSDDFEDFDNQAILGSSLGPVGFSRAYQVDLYNKNDQKFSTFNWWMEGAAATLTQDADEPWKAGLEFAEEGDITLYMVETNSHGVVADTSETEILVIPYCPVDDFADFAGVYTGYDHNWYGINADDIPITVEIVDAEARTVSISDGFWYGLYGPGYWGETVTGGNAPVVTLNIDGSITLENQFAVQTEDAYDYYIGPRSAPAFWNGCEGKIAITIPYIGHWAPYTGGFEGVLYMEMSISGETKGLIQAGDPKFSIDYTPAPPVK